MKNRHRMLKTGSMTASRRRLISPLMEQFHSAEWETRPALIDQIADARVKEFAQRLIYFERPDFLPAAKVAELDAWRAARMASDDDSVPWMTIGKALREADDLLQNATPDEAVLLCEVKDFLYELAGQASPA